MCNVNQISYHSKLKNIHPKQNSIILRCTEDQMFLLD